MNERFLFRGKRKDNGEWVYGGIYYQKSESGKRMLCLEILMASLTGVGI